ncbi:beta-galactosidase-1-like protein 2 [Coccinella septempunctata]|uniref:beta-galactosidase-1-like protein 2 n=1 Tax=Coccinella septempunctata TaxID=41139 RepID=UPI001D06627C|nr:beta-galactosidase-1-like protein 2 [Coccinella septempunctata]
MTLIYSIVVCCATMALTVSAVLPTLYEYYTLPKIETGLSANQSYFTLNGRNISLYSGALHYFRVPKPYWRDRLRKMRAAGLNAVETYIPWNLHEYEDGKYDFGKGGTDMQDFLDVKEFFQIAKEEDLFAIARPGPFICAEWEFGGFPSWLLRTKDIKVRTSDSKYMKYVTRYFDVLLPILALLQFTNGGPIVAFQIENEYGSTEGNGFEPDRVYLRQLVDLYRKNGIRELLVSSDSPTAHGDKGTLPGVLLQTANFAGNPKAEFDKLKELQHNKPTMSMEFWTGWFDHWSEYHHTRDDDDFGKVYEQILSYPASVNMYMFHGGTSFGFLNGANLNNAQIDNSGYQPDTTSYDYDAPLTEAGDYTEKYVIVKKLLNQYNKVLTKLPVTPAISEKIAYPKISVEKEMMLDDILANIHSSVSSFNLLSMENLPINNGSGQSFGYTLYRKENIDLPPNSVLTIEGRVCDSVVVLVNGVLMSKPLLYTEDLNGFGFWKVNNSKLTLGPRGLKNATLDLLVENWGRVNFGLLPQFNQFKGLWQGGVLINKEKVTSWKIYPIEFKKSWNNNLVGWKDPSGRWAPGPSLHKATLNVKETKDTFVSMEGWTKGIVIVNGFVLGRYARIGPQQTLYLPAPFLKNGTNTILVFEHYMPAPEIKFCRTPHFKTIKRKGLQGRSSSRN